MKETTQLRNLMEAIDIPNDKKENCSNCGDPYNKDGVCTNCGDRKPEEVKEDWGSSDWGAALDSFKRSIEAGESYKSAAYHTALFYNNERKWRDDPWSHFSPNSLLQMAQTHGIIGDIEDDPNKQEYRQGYEDEMESVNEAGMDDAEYEAFVDYDEEGDPYVVLSGSGHEVAKMDLDVWNALHKNVKAAIEQEQYQARQKFHGKM